MSTGCNKTKCRCKCNRCKQKQEQVLESNVRIRGNLIVEGTTNHLSDVIVHGRITDEQGGFPRLGPPGGITQGLAIITVIQAYNLSQLSSCVAVNPTTFNASALTINIDEVRFTRYRVINVGASSLAVDIAGQSFLLSPCSYLNIQFEANSNIPVITGPIAL